MKYKSIEELFGYIEGPLRHRLPELFTKHKREMFTAQGSEHNHQAWPGGYIDHVVEVMNIARMLHQAMSAIRPLPFTVSDALIVLFLHDIEKAFPDRIHQKQLDLAGTDSPRSLVKGIVRCDILQENDLLQTLTVAQARAIDNIEVEKNYTNTQRGMSPLAAFCHMCDITSARVWFDRPLPLQEKWGWRESLTVGDDQLWGV